MMKTWITIAALLVLLLAYTVSVWYFQDLVVHYNKKKGYSQYDKRVEDFDTLMLPRFSPDTFYIQGAAHALIRGRFIEAATDTAKGLVILNHGITSDRWDMARYVAMYRNAGFHTVLYDLRNHGFSSGGFSSYGYYEKLDLAKLFVYWKQHYPGLPSGLHGVSMGAATVLQALPLIEHDWRIAFAVADCSYSSLYAQLRHRMKADYGIPNLGLLQGVSLWTGIRYGFRLSDVSPLEAVAESKTPVLFIHGQADTFVPFRMGKALYNAHNGPKALWSVPEATHAKSYTTAPQKYEGKVLGFIKEYL